MTQVVLLKSENLPTKTQIEEKVKEYGYELIFNEEFERFENLPDFECFINGNKTFVESYFEKPSELKEYEFIQQDISDQDLIISFIWGADSAAGAAIGLINVALIDLSDAKSYYLDDEMVYTKDMLLKETPELLRHLK